jgi:hypothetical protein
VHVSDVLREDEGVGERCDGGGEVEQVAGVGGECCGGFGEDVRALDVGDAGERGLRGQVGLAAMEAAAARVKRRRVRRQSIGCEGDMGLDELRACEL